MSRFILDGILVEEVPTSQLPKTNACNYCILKGTECYTRQDVNCHGDSRPDGLDIVFRKASPEN